MLKFQNCLSLLYTVTQKIKEYYRKLRLSSSTFVVEIHHLLMTEKTVFPKTNHFLLFYVFVSVAQKICLSLEIFRKKISNFTESNFELRAVSKIVSQIDLKT